MDLTNFSYKLPIDISTHGAAGDQLIQILHYFMVVLFVGWGIYLVYCLVRFRERPNHLADVSPKHFTLPKFIEIGVVLFEAVILVFISMPTWAKIKTDFPAESEALVVRVTAEQFAWNCHYPGRDGKFGARKQELIDGTNPIGLDREDPDGKDDILSINQFSVPVNKPVIIKLTSKDVIHSFAIPEMRVKQDVIPGMEIPVWFQATQEGDFDVQCAQLCGISHYRMKGFFHSLSAEKYEEWLKEEEKSLTAGMDTLAQHTTKEGES